MALKGSTEEAWGKVENKVLQVGYSWRSARTVVSFCSPEAGTPNKVELVAAFLEQASCLLYANKDKASVQPKLRETWDAGIKVVVCGFSGFNEKMPNKLSA